MLPHPAAPLVHRRGAGAGAADRESATLARAGADATPTDDHDLENAGGVTRQPGKPVGWLYATLRRAGRLGPRWCPCVQQSALPHHSGASSCCTSGGHTLPSLLPPYALALHRRWSGKSRTKRWLAWLVLVAAVCLAVELLGFTWQVTSDALCDVSPRQVSYTHLAPHIVDGWLDQNGQPRIRQCQWALRNASEVLENVPRDKAMRDAECPLLHLAHRLWTERGLLMVPRRGSALEVYRGRRGDADLDFFLIYPASYSAGCVLRTMRATIDAYGWSDVIEVSSSYPFNYLIFDRFLPAMLRTPLNTNAKIDVELFREDLLYDASYVRRMRADHGNAGTSISDFFTSPPCLCTMDDVAPDAELLCMDDPDMRRHLEAAYGSDFMIPRDYERHADVRNLRALWRAPVVSQVFQGVYAWVSYIHKLLGPPQAENM